MNRPQKRYFPGHAPVFAADSDEESSSGGSDRGGTARPDARPLPRDVKPAAVTQPAAAAPACRRPRIQAKVVKPTGDLNKQPAPAASDAIPTGFVPAAAAAEAEAREQPRPESSADESSSESSSSSGSSASAYDLPEPTSQAKPRKESPPRTLPATAPIFIPKSMRAAMGMANADGGGAASAAGRRRAVERAEREQAAKASMLGAARERGPADYDLQRVDMATFPDDTDRPEEAEAEFAMWRVRELRRVMRERGMEVDDGGDEGGDEGKAE